MSFRHAPIFSPHVLTYSRTRCVFLYRTGTYGRAPGLLSGLVCHQERTYLTKTDETRRVVVDLSSNAGKLLFF